jgi:hypothetical protein
LEADRGHGDGNSISSRDIASDQAGSVVSGFVFYSYQQRFNIKVLGRGDRRDDPFGFRSHGSKVGDVDGHRLGSDLGWTPIGAVEMDFFDESVGADGKGSVWSWKYCRVISENLTAGIPRSTPGDAFDEYEFVPL